MGSLRSSGCVCVCVCVFVILYAIVEEVLRSQLWCVCSILLTTETGVMFTSVSNCFSMV